MKIFTITKFVKYIPLIGGPWSEVLECQTVSPSSSFCWSAVLFSRDDTLASSDPEGCREAALWMSDWMSEQFGLEPEVAGQALADVWREQASSWWGSRTQEDEDSFWRRHGEELGTRLGLDEGEAGQVLAALPYECFLKPAEGAREVLGELRARGLKTGVLSNTLPSIDGTLRMLGLDDLIDVTVASCAVGVHKPEAGAFEEALNWLGLPAQEMLFVDDRPENVEAARALGMTAVRIDLSGRVPGALHSLRDVLPLVDGLVPG